MTGMHPRSMARIRQLFDTEPMSREWAQVEEMIREDPDLFRRALYRSARYKKRIPPGKVGGGVLWIACNVIDSLKAAPWCYFCGRPVSRDDFMSGRLHLEHFLPLSGDGLHTPVNITLACDDCNLLKKALRSEELVAALDDPETFFANRNFKPDREAKLRDFVEIFYPRVAGLSGYAERYGIDTRLARRHWESRQEQYRAKWQKGSHND